MSTPASPIYGNETVDTLAAKIKAKYPDYASVDNRTLVGKIIQKYPQYQNRLSTDEIGRLTAASTPTAPTTLRGALHYLTTDLWNAPVTAPVAVQGGGPQPEAPMERASRRFLQTTLGTEHPLEQIASEAKAVVQRPVQAAKALGETVGIPQDIWAHPTLENIGQIGGTGIPGILFNPERGLLQHPITALENITGATQASEDIAQRKYAEALGDIAGGVTNLGILTTGTRPAIAGAVERVAAFPKAAARRSLQAVTGVAPKVPAAVEGAPVVRGIKPEIQAVDEAVTGVKQQAQAKLNDINAQLKPAFGDTEAFVDANAKPALRQDIDNVINQAFSDVNLRVPEQVKANVNNAIAASGPEGVFPFSKVRQLANTIGKMASSDLTVYGAGLSKTANGLRALADDMATKAEPTGQVGVRYQALKQAYGTHMNDAANLEKLLESDTLDKSVAQLHRSDVVKTLQDQGVDLGRIAQLEQAGAFAPKIRGEGLESVKSLALTRTIPGMTAQALRSQLLQQSVMEPAEVAWHVGRARILARWLSHSEKVRDFITGPGERFITAPAREPLTIPPLPEVPPAAAPAAPPPTRPPIPRPERIAGGPSNLEEGQVAWTSEGQRVVSRGGKWNPEEREEPKVPKGIEAPPEPLPVATLPPEVQRGIADLRAEYPKQLADYSDETIAGFIQQQRAKFLKGQMRATLRKSFKKSSAPPETMPPVQGTPSPQGSSPTSSPTGANEAAVAAFPVSLAQDAGLVYKGELSPGSSVYMFEHPDYPGKTMAVNASEIPATNTRQFLQGRMEDKLAAFGRPSAPTSVRQAVDVATQRRLALLEKQKTAIPEVPKSVTLGASGESAASQEAISRVTGEKAAGVKRFRVDNRSGKETPLIGVDAVDAKAGPYDVIVQRGPQGETVLDQGAKARPRTASSTVAARRSLLSRQAAPSTESVSAGDHVHFSGGRMGVIETAVTDKTGTTHYIVRNDRTKGTHFVRASEIKKLGK